MSSKGVNSQGNAYTTPGGSNNGSSSYHYSNSNGSYYYKNDNGSTYYNSGSGYSRYTAPSGSVHESSGSFLISANFGSEQAKQGIHWSTTKTLQVELSGLRMGEHKDCVQMVEVPAMDHLC